LDLALFLGRVVRGAVFVRFGCDASRQCAGDSLRSLRRVRSRGCAALELCTRLVTLQCACECLQRTRVRRVVLPAPLGPSRTKEGTKTEALWRYKIKWKMIGSDRASTKVKTMAPMVGLKLHVSHSRAVSMSTAVLVCVWTVEYGVAREAIQGIDRSKLALTLPDHAAAFPPCGPNAHLPKSGDLRHHLYHSLYQSGTAYCHKSCYTKMML
jgi:hypothetical protein